MVATAMESVKQDAAFGAGHAKWGDLDPSLLVLRPRRAAAAAFARAWRRVLEGEAAKGGGVGPGGSFGGRAPRLMTAWLRGGGWPGVEELDVQGVRQNSRLLSLASVGGGGGGGSAPAARAPATEAAMGREAAGALLGVLPLALFPSGPPPQGAAAAWNAPYCVRPCAGEQGGAAQAPAERKGCSNWQK